MADPLAELTASVPRARVPDEGNEYRSPAEAGCDGHALPKPGPPAEARRTGAYRAASTTPPACLPRTASILSLTVRDVEGQQERPPSRDLVGQDGLDALGSGTPIRWLCTPRSTGSADERMLLHSRPHTTVAALLRSLPTLTFAGADGPPGSEPFASCLWR